MANYASLLATIAANIYTNGDNEVTAAMVKAACDSMVASLGAGYQFMGVATPTSPGTAQTPDQKVFYLASTPGTYTYLGGLVVADGEVAVLKYDSSWSKVITGAATGAALAGVIDTIMLGWILSESFSITSATYGQAGATSASIVWPDNIAGNLVITRDTSGNTTQIDATHNTETFRVTITRDADGHITASSITKL